MQTVKIHGIFRSGTNLAKYMLGQQFSCETSFHLGGHKHLPLPCLPGVTEVTWRPTVVCVKNPLANIVSLYGYARTVKFRHFDCGRTFDEFLRGRLLIRMNGNLAWPAYRFNGPVDYWNAFYANAFSIPPQHLFVLNYEALLRDPVAVMDQLAARFPDLPRTGARCELPLNKVARGADFQPAAPLEGEAFERTAWYLDREYLTQFGDAQLEFALRELDPDVLAAAGYAAADISRRP